MLVSFFSGGIGIPSNRVSLSFRSHEPYADIDPGRRAELRRLGKLLRQIVSAALDGETCVNSTNVRAWMLRRCDPAGIGYCYELAVGNRKVDDVLVEASRPVVMPVRMPPRRQAISATYALSRCESEGLRDLLNISSAVADSGTHDADHTNGGEGGMEQTDEKETEHTEEVVLKRSFPINLCPQSYSMHASML